MKKIFILGAFACLVSAGCKKELDKQPTTTLSAATYWTSEANAISAVNYIYARCDYWDHGEFLTNVTDDSYDWAGGWPAGEGAVGNGSESASSGFVNYFWAADYKIIAEANDVLGNIGQVPGMAPAMTARLSGEARFLRAYAYQQLVGMFGDVPLITKTPTVSEFNVARTPKAQVVSFITSELGAIANDLPVSYDAADQGRATKGAALALKARVELYNGDWANAATDAQAVMNLNVYGIDPNYNSLFNGTNKTSPEIIFSIHYQLPDYSGDIATWICGPTLGGWSQICPTQALVDSYECTDGKTIDQSPLYNPNNVFANRDPRLAFNVIVPGSTVNGQVIDPTQPNSIDHFAKNNASHTGYYYRKYVPAVIQGGYEGNSGNDLVYLRYAEVLLTYAEAKIESGNIDQSVYNAINQVRQRPGVNMPPATAVNYPDQASLRTLVRRERRVEFPVEDQRFYDIRRWKIAAQVMQGPVYGVLNNFDATRADYGQHVLVEQRNFNAQRDYLWPIPQNEVNLNHSLTQNPGW
jgi:hypothetical protein